MNSASSERLAELATGTSLQEDDAVRTLAPTARRRMAELWRRRAENELRTSSVFAQLDAELRAFGAPNEVLALSRQAVDDEVFHARLCQLAAQAYLGEPAPLTSPVQLAAPTFPVCSPRLHRALFAALHSAVNETLAVTYVAACLAEARSSVAQCVLKAILSDEVRHSRIGWAVLASPQLTAQDRQSIAGFMPALLDTCVSKWLCDIEAEYPDDLPAGHGCLAHTGIAQAVDDALQSVILPGLEHVGVDATAARRWVAQARK